MSPRLQPPICSLKLLQGPNEGQRLKLLSLAKDCFLMRVFVAFVFECQHNGIASDTEMEVLAGCTFNPGRNFSSLLATMQQSHGFARSKESQPMS